MTSNLPNINGASVVYGRALRILEHINAREYARQVEANKGRKLRSYRPPYDADLLVNAMNKGDEEMLKGLVASYAYHIYN